MNPAQNTVLARYSDHLCTVMIWKPTMQKPDLFKTALFSTIQNPDMSWFRIPSAFDSIFFRSNDWHGFWGGCENDFLLLQSSKTNPALLSYYAQKDSKFCQIRFVTINCWIYVDRVKCTSLFYPTFLILLMQAPFLFPAHLCVNEICIT